MNRNPLGTQIPTPREYSPELLFGIGRYVARKASGILEPLPFIGEDIWNCYELSWLDPAGVPLNSLCRITYSSHSPQIVESKSLKLYLYSLNMCSFSSTDQVVDTIKRDLVTVVGSDTVVVELLENPFQEIGSEVDALATCIDKPSTAHSLGVVSHYTPTPHLLRLQSEHTRVSETVYSQVFRSLCPVTAQPDWATVTVQYDGCPLDHGGLLAYLVSYRNHQGFHEDCCERIFMDIVARCAPLSLSVMCNFLRRGGIDINPVRSMPNTVPVPYRRTAFQ